MNFLLEIATEELPTAAVQQLSEAGTQLWAEQLIENGFNCESIKAFATPRRLAWRMHNLSEKQVPQISENQGPSLKVAKDADGNWTRAAIGFAKGCGLNSPDELSTIETPKGTHLFYREERPSATFAEKLPEIFAAVIHKLPIAKRMRWGDNEQSFVRPVNALVALADDKVLPLEFFGLQSGRETQGHRVHHPTPVVISHADNYGADLAEAYVIVDSEARRQEIISQVQAVAHKVGGKAVMPEALIDEVAALTEYPQAIYGEFEARFLDVPQEVLITTMQDNQKTFAVVDEKGKLLPCFIAVANLISERPELVSMGNERVIRPRFADAEFFWQQDLKHPLAERLPKLENVVYQEKLGSIADKSRRVAKIAAALTELTEADKDKVQQAAELAKCDLLSEMVMEFPELQGYMGRKYAEKEGLDSEVAAALQEQYYPLGAGGELPQTAVGTTLALAEKLDNLAGGFAIGAKPTGSKDPYALRRATIGLLRLALEKSLAMDLRDVFTQSLKILQANRDALKLDIAALSEELTQYSFDRLENHYKEQGIDPSIFRAAQTGDSELQALNRRVFALRDFLTQENAASFLDSAKRIRNILKKNGSLKDEPQESRLQEAAEKTLYQQWTSIQPALHNHLENGDYPQALAVLGTLSKPLADFFDNVMVMCDEPKLRMNRLALLSALQRDFDELGDLSLIGVAS